MTGEFKEYATVMVTNKEGQEIELAIVDEFDYAHKHYCVCALVEGDTINEDGLYIYKLKEAGEEFQVEKITNPINYQKIAQAYMEMEKDEK